eukprot:scaffold267893_cov31-Prasinocladus_malaysianus.AAC.1
MNGIITTGATLSLDMSDTAAGHLSACDGASNGDYQQKLTVTINAYTVSGSSNKVLESLQDLQRANIEVRVLDLNSLTDISKT